MKPTINSFDQAHYNYVLAAVGNQETIWVYCIPSFSASSALFGSGPELRVQTDLAVHIVGAWLTPPTYTCADILHCCAVVHHS